MKPEVLTLDIETYYDRDYSLSKLTTEEYIRSPLFEVIGLSIKQADWPTYWHPRPMVQGVLKAVDWSNKIVVCQNTMFDGAALSWLYGIKPLAWVDTMGMSRALFPHEKSHSLAAQAQRMGVGAKGDAVLHALGKHYADFSVEELAAYGEYCNNDVELTYELFTKYMAMGFPRRELEVMDMILRMYIEPCLRLDKVRLHDHLNQTIAEKQQLLLRLLGMSETGTAEEIKSRLMSNDQFALMLRKLGVEPPMKISPTTGKQTYAFAKTDPDFQALLEHDSLEVQALVAARLGNKSTLEETRTQRFISIADRGTLPVPLRYYAAHTGRKGGADSLNLQNLPSRGPKAGQLKKAIIAPEGHVVIDCDSAQIEARCLAWEAGQDDLVQTFADKKDVYKRMAARIYGIEEEDVTKPQRFIGKQTVLGSGYGMGPARFKIQLERDGVDLPLEECQRINKVYRDSVPKIVELWMHAQEAIVAMAQGRSLAFGRDGMFVADPQRGICLPNGLYIQYPDLHTEKRNGKLEYLYRSKGAAVRIYGPKVVENLTQALANIIVAEQALRINRRYKVVLTVHDANAAVARAEEAEEAQAYIEECMRWVPPWAQGLPLACESGVGASYGDC